MYVIVQLCMYLYMYVSTISPAVSVQVTHTIPASVAIIRGLSSSPMALWLCYNIFFRCGIADTLCCRALLSASLS